jgi:hypothetical protein
MDDRSTEAARGVGPQSALGRLRHFFGEMIDTRAEMVGEGLEKQD